MLVSAENYKLRVIYAYHTNIYDLTETGQVITKNDKNEEVKVPFFSVIKNKDTFFLKADVLEEFIDEGSKVWKVIKTFK